MSPASPTCGVAFSCRAFRCGTTYERGPPVPLSSSQLLSRDPPKALGGSISKVNFQETLSILSDKCPQNGSKTAPTAPRPHLGCPHEGSRVERASRDNMTQLLSRDNMSDAVVNWGAETSRRSPASPTYERAETVRPSRRQSDRQ